MTTLVHEIANRIAQYAYMTSPPAGGLGFQILERWPSPTGAGATPEAFDPTNVKRLKRVIVVMDGGEVPWSGRQPGLDFRRWDSFPMTYIFAEAHDNGKQAAQTAFVTIEGILHQWDCVVDGQHVSIRTDTRLVQEESDAFPHNILVAARWRASGVRRLVAI